MIGKSDFLEQYEERSINKSSQVFSFYKKIPIENGLNLIIKDCKLCGELSNSNLFQNFVPILENPKSQA